MRASAAIARRTGRKRLRAGCRGARRRAFPGAPAPAENDEKKGTVSAMRRRARMETSRTKETAGRGAPRPPDQKRVRTPVVSSSWFFAPNVDDTV